MARPCVFLVPRFDEIMKPLGPTVVSHPLWGPYFLGHVRIPNHSPPKHQSKQLDDLPKYPEHIVPQIRAWNLASSNIGRNKMEGTVLEFGVFFMSTSITPENAMNIVSMWSKSRSRTCHSRYFSQKIILFYIGYPFQVPWLFLVPWFRSVKTLQMLGFTGQAQAFKQFRIFHRDQQLSSIHLLEYVMHDFCWK